MVDWAAVAVRLAAKAAAGTAGTRGATAETVVVRVAPGVADGRCPHSR